MLLRMLPRTRRQQQLRVLRVLQQSSTATDGDLFKKKMPAFAALYTSSLMLFLFKKKEPKKTPASASWRSTSSSSKLRLHEQLLESSLKKEELLLFDHVSISRRACRRCCARRPRGLLAKLRPAIRGRPRLRSASLAASCSLASLAESFSIVMTIYYRVRVYACAHTLSKLPILFY